MIYIFTFPSGPFYNNKKCHVLYAVDESIRERYSEREREQREWEYVGECVCVCGRQGGLGERERGKTVFFGTAFLCIVFTVKILRVSLKENWARQNFY